MEILIYFNRRSRKHIVRDDTTREQLGAFDTSREAKAWIAANHPGVITWHAGPGGLRQVPWITKCDCCGRAFERPSLK